MFCFIFYLPIIYIKIINFIVNLLIITTNNNSIDLIINNLIFYQVGTFRINNYDIEENL